MILGEQSCDDEACVTLDLGRSDSVLPDSARAVTRRRVELLFALATLCAVLAAVAPMRVLTLGLTAGAVTIFACATVMLWQRRQEGSNQHIQAL